MGKQILFCVETSRRAKTDSVYIDDTLKTFYCIGNDIRKRYIYLNGKSNFNKPKIHNDIKSQTTQYSKIGATVVIYCIDTDRYDSDPNQKKELIEICRYCEENEYELVWFCRDVEDVFWGEQIAKDKKTVKAKQFRTSNRIKEIPETVLRADNYLRHYSNILTVLDKHLERQ